MNDEHVRAKKGTFVVRDVWEDPFRDACGMSTWWKGIRATNIKDGIEGTATVRICGVSHNSIVNHESGLVMAIDD